jgi:DNA-binding GntR family transcriptional regulator
VSGDGQALVDELAAQLQGRVLSGEIPKGTWLRQETLAAEFGVSRTPVREALRKLQASGLVEMRPKRGALVRMPNARDVREAYEVRAELEGLAARVAATRLHDEELQRLREAQELFRRSVATLLAWSERPASRRPARHARSGTAPTTSSTSRSSRLPGTAACWRPSPTCTSASHAT